MLAARIEARHSEEFSKYLIFSPLDQAQHPQRYVWAWKMGQGADQELNLDYPSCRRLFKDYTGLSPYQYFLQLKIHRARHLLQEGNLSVKEVSYEPGFDNQYYFSRIFKEMTGRSPSEWQRRSQP